MADKRKKVAQICVKNGAQGNGTLELFSALEWGGLAGYFRLRYRRAWMDGTHGAKRFFSKEEIGALVSALLFSSEFCAENSANTPPKNMRYKTRISVPNGRTSESRDVTTISTETPFKGSDGQWYIGAHLIGRGVVMIPCGDVIIKEVRL